PDVTEVLLKAGVAADQQDADGRTALLQAACAGNAGVVKLLLNHGANPTRHPAGESALECARQMKGYERQYPQRLLDSAPAFVKDFDTVIKLLEQALAKRQRMEDSPARHYFGSNARPINGFPGLALVCFPPSITTVPLTMVYGIPTG